MSANVPEALKSAGLSRFALRATQLEKVKPVIAYWCNYWLVNQILSRRLHTVNDESKEYTSRLMDKLEKSRAELDGNDAITDEVAAQAVVEHFALETFQRADNAITANKVTAVTADTFLAAATIMEVLAVWGKVDSEIQTKVKYAKYHAVRIQKALKAGDDPNLSNPVQVPESAPKDNGDQIPLAPSPIDGARYQAYVEDAPEHNDTSLIPYSSPQSFKPMPPNPSTTAPVFREMSPSLPQTESEPHQQQDDVSPIESAQSERVSSAGGGYFPQGPAMPSNLPIGPAPVTSTGSPFTPVPSAPILPSAPPSGVYPSQSPLPQSVQFGTTPPPSEKRQAPQHQLTTPPPPNFAYNQQAASGQQFTPAPIPSYTVPTYAQEVPNQITQYNRDDQAILDAQKHAKWAVSALNFEDVETAVKELRIALQALGAR